MDLAAGMGMNSWKRDGTRLKDIPAHLYSGVQRRSAGRESGVGDEADAVGRHCLQILTAGIIRI